MNELNKLEEYLNQHGYRYERTDENKTFKDFDLSRHQIVVYDENGDYLWDAICHHGSYGYEVGLLEIMGTIVSDNAGDSVEGFLKAQDIIDRLESKHERSAE